MTFEEVKSLMQQDKTYSKSFDSAIGIYIDLLNEYEEAIKKSKSKNLKHERQKFFAQQKKVLREQLAKYQTMLLLTPQSRLNKKETKEKAGGLEKALDGIFNTSTGGDP